MKKETKEYVQLVRQEELILDVTEKLVEALEEACMSRTQLAERLGCTSGYVTQLLGGGKNLTLRTISDVALSLDLKPVLLLAPEDLAHEHVEWFPWVQESLRWDPPSSNEHLAVINIPSSDDSDDELGKAA